MELDEKKLVFLYLRQGREDAGNGVGGVIQAVADCCHDVIDTGGVGVKAVETEFVLNDRADKQTGADAERKADDVDAGLELILPKLA